MEKLSKACRSRLTTTLGALLVLLVLDPQPAVGAESGVSAESTGDSSEEPVGGEFVSTRQNCISTACHSEMNRKKFVHGPSAREACRTCHVPRASLLAPEKAPPGECVAVWKPFRPMKELCTSCHKLGLRNVVHEPIREGECDSCHDPHESEHPHILKKDLAKDLCVECHSEEEEFQSREHVHGPVESGACILCHEAHSSWNDHLLLETGSALCLSCHEEIQSSLRAARHVHSPVEEDCGSCHDPHASDYPHQLAAPIAGLCLECHPEVQELMDTSEYVHGALEEERSCLACHTGHASPFPRILAQPLLDSCLGCHDEPIEASDGSQLTDMAKLLRENPEHHGPIRRADCSGCHDPHASGTFRLLVKEYPGEFYLPRFDVKSYELCFECHFREMVLVERGPGVTRFQQDDLNLHYLHVNREKSRTCRACHAVHASKNPLHMRDSFVFGAWKDAPVKFEPLPGGGSCAPACHKNVRYERGSEVPVPSVKPEEPSPGDQEPTDEDTE